MEPRMDVWAANRLFRRDNCIHCPNTLPLCHCTPNEICQETSRSCLHCASRSCVPSSTPQPTTVSSDPGRSSPSNVGAIVGGVIGALVALGLLGSMIWWFVMRKRKQQQEMEETDFRDNMQARRSVASVASTALTRASNVIQIAYIPGVTNRSPPDSPGTLVPPVPPIPSAYPSNASTPAYAEDQHFFMPGDIRDSHYSEMTVDRRSIATSLARSSVATTIYGSNAVASPIPVQRAFSGKASVVSVRSGSSSPGDAVGPRFGDIPNVPPVTEAQLSRAGMANSSIIARSVIARPVNLKKPSQTKVPTVTEEDRESDVVAELPSSKSILSRPDRLSNKESSSSNVEDDQGIRRKLKRASRAATEIDDSPSTETSPFSDKQPTLIVSSLPAADGAVSSGHNSQNGIAGSNHRQRSSVSSNRLREDAAANSANLATATESGTERSESPFSDAHAVKE